MISTYRPIRTNRAEKGPIIEGYNPRDTGASALMAEQVASIWLKDQVADSFTTSSKSLLTNFWRRLFIHLPNS